MIHLLSATVDDVLDVGDRLVGGTGGAGARRLVTPADRAAADARLADEDRRRTLAGRLALRLLAGRVLGSPPTASAGLPIDRTCDRCGGPHGRPRLVGLSASTSTSGDQVLAAVAAASAHVGVDVERVPVALWDGFDEFALHPAERGALPDGDAGVLRRVAIWTGKEAVLKSVGVGLRAAPSGFHVATSPVGDAPTDGVTGWLPVARSDDPATAGIWTTAVDVPGGAVASLAAVGPRPIRSWLLGGLSGPSGP
ncbi:4'-phosphopantetheinyl transferase superfamily protein [Curtobacterium sp. MCSS17_015]|uniref:4'-phosphopantetheinyl transferase family protein n=1 Tax=Curtobacterium sp. MCSS17_015 TaxID=2175666 RepID=UPI0015E8DB33|nr:4'-phosphopantetheinyl transferase superfamily protein [Curtobacterium sp. MCSS17_015]WIB26582.1 4'-phosphopantetheinyl transferase superfamily protein [Curtobacterium sp. MCSS17_015]